MDQLYNRHSHVDVYKPLNVLLSMFMYVIMFSANKERKRTHVPHFVSPFVKLRETILYSITIKYYIHLLYSCLGGYVTQKNATISSRILT